ncbi:porin [Escherichia coli O45:H2 str. 2010C-4211]|nr:porin [Escherichia coli O111:NM str. 01-3076]KDV28080.1 porin [Escherichia coli O145:H25 str. 07-3858]KDV58029.1 porin [Escherichia coli O45:H2 str. 2010C-4211]
MGAIVARQDNFHKTSQMGRLHNNGARESCYYLLQRAPSYFL